MHVWSLPTLHNGLAENLEMSIGLIVAGSRVVPSCLAVLSFVKYWLCGGHFEALESGH